MRHQNNPPPTLDDIKAMVEVTLQVFSLPHVDDQHKAMIVEQLSQRTHDMARDYLKHHHPRHSHETPAQCWTDYQNQVKNVCDKEPPNQQPACVQAALATYDNCVG